VKNRKGDKGFLDSSGSPIEKQEKMRVSFETCKIERLETLN